MQFYDLFVDLYSYQRWGPGSQLNLDTSCILLKDLLDNLKGMSKGKPDVLKVIIRVGHGGTITNAVGRLGLFVSKVPMKAKYYKTLLKKREFTYGKVLPMSGSFAFVLYKCHHAGHKVQLYVNERLVKLPPCHSKFDCTLKSLLDKYEKDFNSCALNYDNVCKPKKAQILLLQMKETVMISTQAVRLFPAKFSSAKTRKTSPTSCTSSVKLLYPVAIFQTDVN